MPDATTMLSRLRRASWVACCFLLAGLFAPWAASAQPQGGDVITLTQARSLNLPAPSAEPPIGALFNTASLPDDWHLSRPGHEGAVWYRVAFRAPVVPQGDVLALFIQRVCSSFELRLNGQLLERGGRLTPPVSRLCYQPQLVTLPTGLLVEGDNTLDVQVVGEPLAKVTARQRAAGLSALQIGPRSVLRGAYDSQVFWTVTASQVIAVTLLMFGGFMIALGYVRGSSYPIYFGVLCLGWAVLSARVWWVDIPLAGDVVELISLSLFAPVTACGVVFLLRYAGLVPSRFEILLWAQCLLLPIVAVLLGPQERFNVAAVAYTVLATEVVVAGGAFLWRVWRARRPEFWLMGAVLMLVGLTIVIEVAVQDDLLALPRLHLIHFAMPLLFFAVGFRLIQTFALALGTAERARIDLEQRVLQITGEVERNFQQLAHLRTEQIAEKERKRIAADLHDDLGAKLLTIVHTSDNERISTLAREALEEMRLSVRGIAGRPVQLADALADWRAETVSRLSEAGIEVEWSSDEVEGARTLAARAYVQTTRILREAVSNLIKHSGATRCAVRCTFDADFHLVVRDNGRGIPMELDGKLDRGHGMASMKHRAKQLQGQCLVESGPGYGTVIRLTLPL
jgi:two-component system sensor histidine kinase UhpB